MEIVFSVNCNEMQENHKPIAFLNKK